MPLMGAFDGQPGVFPCASIIDGVAEVMGMPSIPLSPRGMLYVSALFSASCWSGRHPRVSREPLGAEWQGPRVARELLSFTTGGNKARDITPPLVVGLRRRIHGRWVAEKRFGCV
jgi:hypothetical protein